MTDEDDVFGLPEPEPPARPAATRLLGVAAAVLLVAGVVAAFVVGDGGRTPGERLAAVPAAVSSEPFAYEMTFASSGGATPAPFQLEAVGAVDPGTGRLRLTMDLGSLSQGATSKVAMVTDGDTVYVRLPAGGWARVDAKQFTDGMNRGLPSSTNPLDSFDELRAVDAAIEDLGPEDVRGTRTTHFRTRLDLSKAAKLPTDSPGLATGALGMLRDVPVDVWLDDHDRPRRQRMTFDLGAFGAGTFTITIEAFDFGRAVDIELPPADQVVESGPGGLGSLFGSLVPTPTTSS
jgi:hypothetical protein